MKSLTHEQISYVASYLGMARDSLIVGRHQQTKTDREIWIEMALPQLKQAVDYLGFDLIEKQEEVLRDAMAEASKTLVRSEGVADSLFWEEHFSKPKKPTGAT